MPLNGRSNVAIEDKSVEATVLAGLLGVFGATVPPQAQSDTPITESTPKRLLRQVATVIDRTIATCRDELHIGVKGGVMAAFDVADEDPVVDLVR